MLHRPLSSGSLDGRARFLEMSQVLCIGGFAAAGVKARSDSGEDKGGPMLICAPESEVCNDRSCNDSRSYSDEGTPGCLLVKQGIL